jgi:hygromycin-B 4-O-kinase
MFETTFLERGVFDRNYAAMEDLLDRCPEERFLVHGNYGFGNLLARGAEITAVLDWIDAKYGDFLFDVAWLDFWGIGDDWAGRFREYYDVQGTAVPHYEDRLRCYQLRIGMDAMKFFAKGGDEFAYRWVRDRLLASLI